MSKNEVLNKRLEVLCKCYSTGWFDDLFPLLADNCIMHSHWVMTPNVGKDEVVKYFTGKGKTLRESGSCPKCHIVKLVGNVNVVESENVHLNGGEPQKMKIGLWYEDGKFAMLMQQELDGELIEVLVDVDVDEDGLIAKISLCEPAMFKYQHYRTPYPRHF